MLKIASEVLPISSEMCFAGIVAGTATCVACFTQRVPVRRPAMAPEAVHFS